MEKNSKFSASLKQTSNGHIYPVTGKKEVNISNSCPLPSLPPRKPSLPARSKFNRTLTNNSISSSLSSSTAATTTATTSHPFSTDIHSSSLSSPSPLPPPLPLSVIAAANAAAAVTSTQSTITSISSRNSSARLKYPPNFPRNGSTSTTASFTGGDCTGPQFSEPRPLSRDIEMHGLESATSSSPLHGCVLVSIMLSSLAAFICSKLRDPCEDSYLINSAMNCSVAIALLFSIINISSCLFSFIIYFLHLIGQCDYITWSARRKVSIEIIFTGLMMLTLLIALILLFMFTVATHYPITMFGCGFAIIAILLYGLRILLLARETRMLINRPKLSSNGVSGEQQMPQAPAQQQQQSMKQQQQQLKLKRSMKQSTSTKSNATAAAATAVSTSTPIVLSYVKSRKDSLNQLQQLTPPTPRTLEFNEELEDDVFETIVQ